MQWHGNSQQCNGRATSKAGQRQKQGNVKSRATSKAGRSKQRPYNKMKNQKTNYCHHITNQ
jgi:hypothetical protein